MKDQQFEVWQYDGIPQTDPIFRAANLSEIKNYLKDSVRLVTDSNKLVGRNGEKVFFEGKEISFDKIFDKAEFHMKNQRKKAIVLARGGAYVTKTFLKGTVKRKTFWKISKVVSDNSDDVIFMENPKDGAAKGFDVDELSLTPEVL